MIKRISLKITNFIFRSTTLDTELFEVCKYRIEITISTLLNIFLIIAAGMILSDIISGMIFLAVYISLFPFVGGYHAKTHFLCNALFLLTYLLIYFINSIALALVEGELYSRLLTVLILLGIIPIIAFAPVQHKNRPLSEIQLLICRTIGIAAFILISITALALHYGGIKYGSFMTITLASVSVSILIEVSKQRRKKDSAQGKDSENR